MLTYAQTATIPQSSNTRIVLPVRIERRRFLFVSSLVESAAATIGCLGVSGLVTRGVRLRVVGSARSSKVSVGSSDELIAEAASSAVTKLPQRRQNFALGNNSWLHLEHFKLITAAP